MRTGLRCGAYERSELSSLRQNAILVLKKDKASLAQLIDQVETEKALPQKIQAMCEVLSNMPWPNSDYQHYVNYWSRHSPGLSRQDILVNLELANRLRMHTREYIDRLWKMEKQDTFDRTTLERLDDVIRSLYELARLIKTHETIDRQIQELERQEGKFSVKLKAFITSLLKK